MEQGHIYIGYDRAEPVAYHTCVESILDNASIPVVIHPLYLNTLRMQQPSHKPGYPPSNGFIFSRFLVPYLSGFSGKSLWLDGDMVVEADVAELFQMDLYKLGARVVKHDYTPKPGKKYLNSENQAYPKKNWSSVILWNNSYFPNRHLTPDLIAGASGEWLHRFQWLLDEEVGDLPKGWNVLADEENQATDEIKLIHFTRGTPCFRDYLDSQYAERWFHYKTEMNSHKEVEL